MNKEEVILKASKEIDIRFSEVDSMQIVWHGSYSLYLEDAREEFGRKYGLGYLFIFGNGFYSPLVDMNFSFKGAIAYGTRIRVDIIYKYTEAAKIVFDYEIHDTKDDRLLTVAHSVQVFLDKEYKLTWTNPDFYLEWQKKWGLI
jgi:acyl-CoA thioester hydrolase